MQTNGTMMQYFEWYLPKQMLWRQLTDDAAKLAWDGITALWLPPAYKGASGDNDAGYGVYDLFDLGEFDQKGTVPTKYGTKDELLRAISAAHDAGLQVYADIVLDHKLGADATERVSATECDPQNRNKAISGVEEIEAWTCFTFPGRAKKYSPFEWHWYHFLAIDWDAQNNRQSIYKFHGKEWAQHVDQENGNYDYLMGADIDLNNAEVIKELNLWGLWFLQTTGVDGFRLDAIKHMRFHFFDDWLELLRKASKRELFTVGEYWNGDLDALKYYIDTTRGALSLFDVPLHYRFRTASQNGQAFDMRTIFDGTLTSDNPLKSVTFVDNHDTQSGQSLDSWVQPWFKPLAYALILLRKDGYPCVFYGDYYGIAHDGIPSIRDALIPLLAARRDKAYGEMRDYFDHPNIIGWTMEGDADHPGSGLAVLLTGGDGGEKRMYIGTAFAGKTFVDCTENRTEEIVIESDGNGLFSVNGGSVSVWVAREA